MITNSSDLLVRKTLKGLPKAGSSITVKAEPYDIVLPGSNPYAIINGPNPRTGGEYAGNDNLDGGITQQLATSELSTFLSAFDSIACRFSLNYRYLPITKDKTVQHGMGYVREMLQAIDEVLSVAKSTTFTNLAITNYYIATSLPIPEFSGTQPITITDGDEDLKIYPVGSAEGMYAILITYQTYLQALAGTFNAYNKFRANEGTMMKSSWNRETPALNSFFSLMNKRSMIGLLESMSLILRGEYFDNDWMQQANMIGSLISRESDAVTSPILEIVAIHDIPKFIIMFDAPKLEEGGKTTTTSAIENVKALASTDLNNLVSNQTVNTPQQDVKSIADLLVDLASKLTINDTLYWARKGYQDLTDVERFNGIALEYQILITVANVFKPAFGDLRTMLDVLGRAFVNQWTKNTRLGIYNMINAPATNNMTVRHLLQMIMAGSNSVTWDSNTFRWSLYTPWNKFEGIPEYDAKSGGAFLSFSTKEIVVGGQVGPIQQNVIDYLPIALQPLDPAKKVIYAVNRLGKSVSIGTKVFDPSVNYSTARLVPLSISPNMKLRTPYTETSVTALEESYLAQAIQSVCGTWLHGDEDVSATSDIKYESDILTFIPVEIDDLTNEMINYARTKGPFVVNLADKSSLGFLGLS